MYNERRRRRRSTPRGGCIPEILAGREGYLKITAARRRSSSRRRGERRARALGGRDQAPAALCVECQRSSATGHYLQCSSASTKMNEEDGTPLDGLVVNWNSSAATRSRMLKVHQSTRPTWTPFNAANKFFISERRTSRSGRYYPETSPGRWRINPDDEVT